MSKVEREEATRGNGFCLDNGTIPNFYTRMQSRREKSAKSSHRIGHLGSLALIACLSLFTSGCLQPLAKHSTALAAATAPVVDQAAAAYQAAEKLHDLRVDYDAVSEFDDTQSVYNPRKIQPLLSDKDIQARLAVLTALQCYTKSLVEITSGTSSPALDAASQSIGTTLASLGNAFAPAIQSTLGVAAAAVSSTETTVTTSGGVTTSETSTTSTPGKLITPKTQNFISTAINGLGQFLVSNKIKKELPQQIKTMDPQLQALCELLEKEIDILQDQDQRDFDSIVNRQTLFIRENTKLTPEQRRAEIMKLPGIVRQQRAADQQLTSLRAAIVRLALTHHALAAEAQGDNPESLTGKLGELSAAGNDLGKFYSSLPTQ